jgi:hypothetical protein
MASHRPTKDELRRRIDRLKYSQAPSFTDANDHDPLVLETCPACHNFSYFRDDCTECEGTGDTGRAVRFFGRHAPAIPDCAAEPARPATVDELGWARCPGCQRRFATYSASMWTGRRCTSCGQKIDLVGGPGGG